MARIKVTGYIDTDELNPEYVDTSHASGLSNTGYDQLCKDMMNAGLDDAEFELVK